MARTASPRRPARSGLSLRSARGSVATGALLLFSMLGTTLRAEAQASGGLVALARPYVDPSALPLYRGAAPGSEASRQVEAWASAPNDLVARNVTTPTITPVLPTKRLANGAAVIILPGGGNVVLSMGKEGYDVANALVNRGIAAFVVKYRVNETPADLGRMRPIAPGAVGAPRPANGALPPPPRPTGPVLGVADAEQALRWVRAHATEYGVDPSRVGLIGFSAGAGNIWGVIAHNDPTAKPNFVAPIYGGFGPRDGIPTSPPPLFIAGAADDPIVHSPPGFPVVDQWAKAGGKVELHYYQNGLHGFGALKQGTTSDLVIDEFALWLQANGFLTASR